MPLSRLKAVIISSHCGTSACRLRQKSWLLAAVEIGERDALLLDPGEIGEIEDALALALGGIEHVLDAGSEEMLADQFGRERLCHGTLVVAALEISLQLGSVEFVPVGGHRDDDVARAKPAVFGHLDGAQHVGNRRQTEIAEPARRSANPCRDAASGRRGPRRC